MRYNKSGNNNPNYRHGMSGTPEHRIWGDMVDRCGNNKDKFKNYAGRGIKVHPDFLLPKGEGFLNWFNEIGYRPKGLGVGGTRSKYSQDRIDTNGGYTYGNIRWATDLVQANNKQKPTHVHGSISMYQEGCRCELCTKTGVASNRHYYLKDREKNILDKRQYRITNKEAVNAKAKEKYRRNAVAINARRKELREVKKQEKLIEKT